MTDPWDDAGRSQAGFVVTATGLRVPVAAQTSVAGWPATPGATPGGALPAAGSEAHYRGVGPKGYQRSDPRVREKICERLLLDPYLDASRLVVHVSKGRVTLTGTVPSERMRSAAVAAASSVATGAVDDRLQVAADAAPRSSRTTSKTKRARKRSTRTRRVGRSTRTRGGER